MYILGFTGKMGAGKTTATQYLCRRHGFSNISFVDKILRPRLQQQGLDVNRVTLQQLGTQLYQLHGDVVLTQWLLDGLDPVQHWIVDDIRYPTTAQYLRARFPDTFQLVGMTTAIEHRFARVLARGREGQIAYERFLELDTGETERQIDQVLQMADYRVANDLGLPALYNTVDDVTHKVRLAWGQERE